MNKKLLNALGFAVLCYVVTITTLDIYWFIQDLAVR